MSTVTTPCGHRGGWVWWGYWSGQGPVWVWCNLSWGRPTAFWLWACIPVLQFFCQKPGKYLDDLFSILLLHSAIISLCWLSQKHPQKIAAVQIQANGIHTNGVYFVLPCFLAKELRSCVLWGTLYVKQRMRCSPILIEMSITIKILKFCQENWVSLKSIW